MEFTAGSTIRFDYPAANYIGIRKPRFDQRRLKIEQVRELAKRPLEPMTVDEEPLLRRGSVLITGWDLDKCQERSFYLESMKNIEPFKSPLDQPFEIQIIDGDNPAETIWNVDGEGVLYWLQEWIQQPAGLTVAIVPLGSSQQDAA